MEIENQKLQSISPILFSGLFQGAISASGTALDIWAKPQNLLMPEIARQQAEIVGCDRNATSDEIVECLRDIDAATLVQSADKFKVIP